MAKYQKHHALRSAIVEVIREQRLKKGYTLRELSKELGEHVGYMAEIERQQHAVRVEEFVKVAEALGVAPSRLLVRAIRKAKKKDLKS